MDKTKAVYKSLTDADPDYSFDRRGEYHEEARVREGFVDGVAVATVDVECTICHATFPLRKSTYDAEMVFQRQNPGMEKMNWHCRSACGREAARRNAEEQTRLRRLRANPTPLKGRG